MVRSIMSDSTVQRELTHMMGDGTIEKALNEMNRVIETCATSENNQDARTYLDVLNFEHSQLIGTLERVQRTL
jgi:hypothetical protein